MKGNLKIYFVFLSVLVLAAIPHSVRAVDGQIKIAQTDSTTFPIVIDKSGSYVLTSNIEGGTYYGNVAIQINADNVTLDLNGHSIIGPGKESGSKLGIYAYDKNNIVIKSGTIRDFGSHGISLAPGTYASAADNQIKDIKVFNNGGMGISARGPITIINCIAAYNGSIGIFAVDASISNCATLGNGHVGIEIDDGSITNSTASENAASGISGSNSTISQCTARSNSQSGISVSKSTIINCTASNNGSHGILDMHENRIEGVNLRDNKGYGIYAQGYHSYIIKNSASNNSSGNFYAVSPADNYMPTSLTALDAANANRGW